MPWSGRAPSMILNVPKARHFPCSGGANHRPKCVRFLASKGVSFDIIVEALNEAEQTLGDADLQAARAYAVRRRIGPYRKTDGTLEDRKKELVVLGRAGFRYEVARKIVDADQDFE